VAFLNILYSTKKDRAADIFDRSIFFMGWVKRFDIA